METISGSSSSSSIKSLVNDEFEYDFVLLEEVECLSSWEFVDAFDAEKVHASMNDKVGSDIQNVVLPTDHMPMPLSPREIIVQDHSDDLCEKDNFGYGCSDNLEDEKGNSYDDECEDENEDEDVGDGYDLDEELVPWSVSSKFERQRMRKLGKRVFPKMLISRRSPHLLLRPGCVRGKHGLGLKHNC